MILVPAMHCDWYKNLWYYFVIDDKVHYIIYNIIKLINNVIVIK